MNRRFLLLFLMLTAIISRAQVITTFAGTGAVGFSGGGIPAISEPLYDPPAVCTDNTGNVYIADHGNHVVWKVNNAGIITLFAGDGIQGNSGDGGPATNARLGFPYGICCDNTGNIFITDPGYQLVRKIDPAGIISTVAGTPSVFGYTGNGGPATNATMFSPAGICADNAGNIYFAEFGNQVIRKVSTAGIISTVAGTGTLGNFGVGGPATSAQLNSPTGVSVDNAGNIYIADMGNLVIKKVNTAGIISIFAGTGGQGYSGDGGPATAALFKYPYAVFADNSGNVYISDTGNGVVRMVDNTGTITTIAGNGTIGYSGDGGAPTAAQLTSPAGICKDNAGSIYIADGGAHVIRKIGNCLLPVVTTQPVDKITCPALNTTMYADGTNVTAYQWQVNTGSGWADINDNMNYSGANWPSLQINGPYIAMNGYQYRCKMHNACDDVYSNAATLTVLPDQPPSVSIAASAVNICAGTPVTFTSTVGNTGTNTTYQWQKNGAPAGNDAAVYVDNALADGDIISCTITTNNACNTQHTGTSNNIAITVHTFIQPTISISASDNNVCTGTPINFNATVGNDNNPSYTWKKNGIIVGSNGPFYFDNALNNGDIISCILNNTYSYSCPAAEAVTSNSITINMTAPAMPAVTISAPSTAICAGSALTFTATATSAGPSPIYQWRKNGVPVASGVTYSDNTLNNGDEIFCVLLSSQPCVIQNTVTSNLLTITVNAVLAPAITIFPSTNNICAGTAVTFSSSTTNAGNSPFFAWKKNGAPAGGNTPSYSDNTLNNGDIISCTLASSYACPAIPVANSNAISMNVNTLLNPGITIATTFTSVCPGNTVVFNATASNAGPIPSFQWKKNNVPVGTNAAFYADNTIAQNDIITCTITASGTCVVTPVVTSNALTMSLFPKPIVQLNHTPYLCNGDTRTLNAGSFTAYEWNDGSMANTLQVTTTGTYYVTITDNNGCRGSDTTHITTLRNKPAAFLPKDTGICNFGSIDIIPQQSFNSYLWNNNTTGPRLTITQPGLYWLDAADSYCHGRDSILVIPKDCGTGFHVPTAFTPNNDGRNDVFKPVIFGNVKTYRFTIYNRWGQVLFQTTNITAGWDGRFQGAQQDSNVFIWSCQYQLEGEKQELRKGSVVLVR